MHKPERCFISFSKKWKLGNAMLGLQSEDIHAVISSDWPHIVIQDYTHSLRTILQQAFPHTYWHWQLYYKEWSTQFVHPNTVTNTFLRPLKPLYSSLIIINDSCRRCSSWMYWWTKVSTVIMLLFIFRLIGNTPAKPFNIINVYKKWPILCHEQE